MHKERNISGFVYLAAILMISAAFVMPLQFSSAQNALGLPFGGRIVTPVLTGYVWYNGVTPMYCPPHIIVVSYGPLRGSTIGLFIPPAMPKMYSNYAVPGIAVKGAYYPAPNIALCPFYPVYYSSLMGTSLRP